jgi:hypothetical protein
MTTRLALTVGQSARARREISTGPLEIDAVDLGDDPSRVARLPPPGDRRPAEHRCLVDTFVAAAQTGDLRRPKGCCAEEGSHDPLAA